MGIPFLNNHLIRHCKSIRKGVSLELLKNKTVVIDASIYMYKYLDKDLMWNMYQMIHVFKKYNVVPIFIFDGKTPPEKEALVKKRFQAKLDARAIYDQLVSSSPHSVASFMPSEEPRAELTDGDDSESDEPTTTPVTSAKEWKKVTLPPHVDAMGAEKWRKKSLMVTPTHIRKIKRLMELCDVKYYHAPHEADHMCVWMVQEQKAWACMSDDMDMLMHGCPRVIRHFKMENAGIPPLIMDTELLQPDSKYVPPAMRKKKSQQYGLTATFSYYSAPHIMADLGVTQDGFRDVLSMMSHSSFNQELYEESTCAGHIQKIHQAFATGFAAYRQYAVANPFGFGFHEWMTKHPQLIAKISSYKPGQDEQWIEQCKQHSAQFVLSSPKYAPMLAQFSELVNTTPTYVEVENKMDEIAKLLE